MLAGFAAEGKQQEDKLLKICEEALIARKSVVYFDHEIPEGVRILARNYAKQLQIYAGEKPEKKETIQIPHPGDSNDPDTPVLLIGGLIEQADTLEVLLRLTIQLKEEGFLPSVLSQHPMGVLFGFHNPYAILHHQTWTEVEKIGIFHGLVMNLERWERPDIIIMEAPDAIMRFNTKVPNGYGIYTYMSSLAIAPDAIVLCVPCDFAKSEMIEALNQDFMIRLNGSIVAAHISNIVLDNMVIQEYHRISYAHVSLEEVHEKVIQQDTLSTPMLDVIGDGTEQLGRLVRSIIEP